VKVLLLLISLLVLSACGQEQVDAFYYPNKEDLTNHEFFPNVGSLENCREVVRQAAAKRNDPNFEIGDYECGVGPNGDKLGEIKIYRETTK
jgi:hypothetical protein